MKANVIALLGYPKFVYAFASVTAANPPSPPPSQGFPYDYAWISSANACSKPDFFDVNWKVYNNTKPLCKLYPMNAVETDPWPKERFRFKLMNEVALLPHRVISKRDPAAYVELQKDLKTDIIENHVLQNRVVQDNGSPWYNYPEDATLPKLLAQDDTDGIIIMHQGKIVYENYTPPFTSYTHHRIFSDTKSFVGLMVQMLINAGRLREDDQLTDYVPELKGSGFEGATVGNALNMRVAVAYAEYPDKCAKYEKSGNELPAFWGDKCVRQTCDFEDAFRQIRDNVTSTTSAEPFTYTFSVVPGCETMQMFDATITQAHSSYWEHYYGVPYNPGPQNLREFIPLLQKHKDQEHGKWYDEHTNYKSIITDVLAWVIDKILGEDGSSSEEYFEENLWSKVGQGHDAMLMLGNAQIPWWQGGMSVTLPDMARFSDVLLNGGKNKHGVEVVPEAVLARLRHPPADFLPKQVAGFQKCRMGYRDQFWIGQNQAGEAHADKTWFGFIGIHGQYAWIYPHLNMTVVRQSTDEDYDKWLGVVPCAHDAAFQELGVLLGQIAGSGK
eukprot:CAMPEP_0119397562 /NCGR_PEP_ID=MMETSP1334-20130426/140397_1 /TAXON_ID=127549 /ORGANISM="Calcidiscus leptoporus, Strain RCC1130" /LENGTH=555 /DNA_ID=CAMNT_0007421407 /DNA_START=1236 /DNA_END=2903 /DNA_ORIENTATION=+